MREHDHDFNLRDSLQWLWVTTPSLSETINSHLCLCEVMGAHDGNIFWSPWVFHVIHVIDIDRGSQISWWPCWCLRLAYLMANSNCDKAVIKEICEKNSEGWRRHMPAFPFQILPCIMAGRRYMALHEHHVLCRYGTDNILQPILVVFIWAGSYTCCFCFLFYFKSFWDILMEIALFLTHKNSWHNSSNICFLDCWFWGLWVSFIFYFLIQFCTGYLLVSLK